MCYFEKSKNVISEIDAEKLSNVSLEKASTRGGTYEFRSLGRLSINSSTSPHFGLKTSRPGIAGQAEARAVTELAFMKYILDACPDLKKNVPSFIGLLRIAETGEIAGLLTEDASQDGQRAVSSMPASEDIRDKIYRPFEKLGHSQQVLSDTACEESLSFSVKNSFSETEMLLDLHPSPIKIAFLYKSAEFMSIFKEVIRNIDDITVDVAQTSNLGAALKA